LARSLAHFPVKVDPFYVQNLPGARAPVIALFSIAGHFGAMMTKTGFLPGKDGP
jgi:16S rRNA C1402 (ribose-2'-O) methylase RsmI